MLVLCYAVIWMPAWKPPPSIPPLLPSLSTLHAVLPSSILLFSPLPPLCSLLSSPLLNSSVHVCACVCVLCILVLCASSNKP